uniref:BZIP domain-containing protein n=1 Tax=Haemonchus contortus TaxID=6289 RepID=A0A7I4YTC8_HAECO
MLSRFTRMSSLGAHLISGCTALREPTTAPKPVTPKVESSGRSGSFIAAKENSYGCSPDPFLWHDHENFLAELLELDHWKNDLSPPTSRSSPERQNFTTDDSAEWSSILHSMEWIDKFEALDIPKIDSDYSSDYPESTSLDDACDFLEKSASLIDWKAWNSYLGVDDDLDLDVKTDEGIAAKEQSPKGKALEESFSNVEVKDENGPSPPCEPKPQCIEPTAGNVAFNNKLSEIEKAIVRSSGPLTWLPCVKQEDQYSDVSSRSTSSSVDIANQIRTVKRRGVKMKPPSDDETNHRRWLNREAAFRYRERKRLEQLERKKELEDLVNRNIFLKKKVRELSREVASWQQKLSSTNI